MRCKWCNNEAEIKTFRTIDGMTGSSCECKECFLLTTKSLLDRENTLK